MPDTDTTVLKRFTEIDYHLWRYINVQYRCELLDIVMPILRAPTTWIPLYLFLAIYLPYKWGRRGLWWCLFFITTFGIGDYTSASIIKPMVKRLRPCNDNFLNTQMHLLVDCGSGYSFPSSHATNHFALAVFMILTLGKQWRWIRIPIVMWAAAISYAQVYVGVHFPADVLCGALLGVFVGILTAYVFNRNYTLPKKSA